MTARPEPVAGNARPGPGALLRAGLIALALTGALLAPFNLPLFLNAPDNDSFFSLGPAGRAGLVLLSVVLLGALYWLLGVKSRWLRGLLSGGSILIAGDVVLGWMIYLLGHHLSPQLYYAYYLTLFDGLPAQWVIDANFDWEALGNVVIPGPKARLSDFVACAGFWAVLPYSVQLHRKN